MRNKAFYLVLGVLLLAGCSTMSPKAQPMTTQLQLRVGELERQLDQKDGRIKELEYNLKDLSYEVDRLKAQSGRRTKTVSVSQKTPSPKDDGEIIRVNVSAQEVQQALKSAGYYKAAIDGNVGSGTKQAISDFQKAKGLKADGIIGQQTWTELQKYL